MPKGNTDLRQHYVCDTPRVLRSSTKYIYMTEVSGIWQLAIQWSGCMPKYTIYVVMIITWGSKLIVAEIIQAIVSNAFSCYKIMLL